MGLLRGTNKSNLSNSHKNALHITNCHVVRTIRKAQLQNAAGLKLFHKATTLPAGFVSLSGRIVIHDNIVSSECGNILNLVAIYIYLHQVVAVCQGIHAGQLVVVHVNVGDLFQVCQTVDAAQLVVGAVDGPQGAASLPDGQGDTLVIGEIQDFHFQQAAQHGDVGDFVPSKAQVHQLRAGGQDLHLLQLVVIHRQVAQQGEPLHAADAGQLIIVGAEPAEPDTGADGGQGGQGVVGNVQGIQLIQLAERGQAGDGVMPQVQFRQGGHIAEGIQIPDGIFAQIQPGQILGTGEGLNGAEAAVGQAQAVQGGEPGQIAQVAAGEAAAAEIQGLQTGQGSDGLQGFQGVAAGGQLHQIGHQGQILQIGGGFGDGELGDGPEHVGVNDLCAVGTDGLPHGILHGFVHEGNGLDHAGDGVADDAQGAHQTLVADADGVDGGLTGGESDGFGIRLTGGGGILAVDGVVQLIAGGGQGHVDILAVEACGVAGGGGVGAQLVQLGLDVGVCDVFQHGHRVQQLVLLHIGPAQGNIQLGGAAVGNGPGEGELGLGVIALGFVLLRHFDGDIFVVAGMPVGQVIAQRGQGIIARLRAEPGGAEQQIPGKGAVINEGVPDQAAQDGGHQQHRHQNSKNFSHGKLHS